MTRIGVITFPGTLDDVDALRAVRLAGAEDISGVRELADLPAAARDYLKRLEDLAWIDSIDEVAKKLRTEGFKGKRSQCSRRAQTYF